MIDRLVCADGGNPDPTSTHGKKPAEAKALELQGWDYPKHLDKRVYGLVVHGDVAGIEGSRRALSDWLDWMGLIDAGDQARLDRFIGYYEPYATSHEALDRDDRPSRRKRATWPRRRACNGGASQGRARRRVCRCCRGRVRNSGVLERAGDEAGNLVMLHCSKVRSPRSPCEEQPPAENSSLPAG